jgi:flagellar hook-associated protein 2
MASIALPGLQTGIDTQALVQQLLSASAGPLNRLEARQQRWENKAESLSGVESRLQTLRSAAEEVRVASELRAYQAITNDEQTLTVEANSGAAEGSHEIVINQLAAAERKVHDGLATLDSLVGEGVLAYTYDGQTRSIQTTAETTLEDLRDLINNDGGNPGVRASILEYDAGGDNVYHLVLGGADTGADYTVAIEDGLTTLAGFDSTGFTTTQSAQDAQIRVDGYPSGNWIGRSSNTIDDVLAGVTLELHAAGTVRISLTRDTETLKEKLSTLVEAYNDVVDHVQTETEWDEETQTAGVLMGESSVRHVRNRIRLPFIEGALGFMEGTDSFTLAGQVGLSLDSGGHLELDEETLDEAIAEDYLGVLNLFGADRSGTSNADELSFYAASSLTEPGAYDVRAVFDGGSLVSAQIKRTSEDDGAWRDATVAGNLITGAEGYDEQFLQITAAYAGTGTVEGVVHVRQGLGGRLYDRLEELLDPTGGTMTLAEEHFQNRIAVLQTNIERQQDRLDRMEERLVMKFARLEQALTQLEAQRISLGFTGS